MVPYGTVPVTVSTVSTLSPPTELLTMQRYLPLSSTSASLMIRVPPTYNNTQFRQLFDLAIKLTFSADIFQIRDEIFYQIPYLQLAYSDHLQNFKLKLKIYAEDFVPFFLNKKSSELCP